jgi:hypothetical protein
MNTQLVTLLNKLIKDKVVTIEGLLKLLNISKDSLYRRLRGETDLLLNEALLITEQLNISLDALHGSNKNEKVFISKRFELRNSAMATLDAYISELHKDLKQMHAIGAKHIYYAAKDLPLFCFFSNAKLIPFKLYFWYITIFDAQAKRFEYQPNWLTKDIVDKALEVYQLYNQTHSTEIWNFETINSTLHQIEYCVHAGLVHKEDGLQILNGLSEFVNKLEDYCTVGKKQNMGELTMYSNEILLLDNSVVFDIGIQKILYIPHQPLNFLHITDEGFLADTMEWFNKQLAKSTKISSEGQRDRDRLLNHYRQSIKRCVSLLESKDF